MTKESREKKMGVDFSTAEWFSPFPGDLFPIIKRSGLDFCYIRFTKGLRFNRHSISGDAFLEYGLQGVEAGLRMGLIHVFEPDVDGSSQAINFNGELHRLRRSYYRPWVTGRVADSFTLPMAILLEIPGDPDITRNNLIRFLKQWRDFNPEATIEQLPRISVSKKYFEDHRLDLIGNIGSYGLWLIEEAAGEKPGDWPYVWKQPLLWQYKKNATINDRKVNLNQALPSAIKDGKTKKPGGFPVIKTGTVVLLVGLAVLAKYVSKKPATPAESPAQAATRRWRASLGLPLE